MVSSGARLSPRRSRRGDRPLSVSEVRNTNVPSHSMWGWDCGPPRRTCTAIPSWVIVRHPSLAIIKSYCSGLFEAAYWESETLSCPSSER